jgi:hypothetical protein
MQLYYANQSVMCYFENRVFCAFRPSLPAARGLYVCNNYLKHRKEQQAISPCPLRSSAAPGSAIFAVLFIDGEELKKIIYSSKDLTIMLLT